jgi:hypothetical protein
MPNSKMENADIGDLELIWISKNGKKGGQRLQALLQPACCKEVRDFMDLDVILVIGGETTLKVGDFLPFLLRKDDVTPACE